MHAVGERSDPLAELGGDQSASWPLLTMQKLHKMNSNFDTIYLFSISITKADPSLFSGLAPPLERSLF